MCLYNYRNNYAPLSYMEYPVILIQELILIYFVLYYKRLINTRSLFQASIYFAVASGFFTGFFSKDILTFLVVCLRTNCYTTKYVNFMMF